jgi:hypothetical protein
VAHAVKGKVKLSFTFVMDKELASNQALFIGIEAQLKKIGVEVNASTSTMRATASRSSPARSSI